MTAPFAWVSDAKPNKGAVAVAGRFALGAPRKDAASPRTERPTSFGK